MLQYNEEHCSRVKLTTTMNVPKHVSFLPYKCICAKCNLIQGIYFYIWKGHIVRTGSHMLNSFSKVLSLSCKLQNGIVFFILAQFAMLMVKSRNANEGSFGQKMWFIFLFRGKSYCLKMLSDLRKLKYHYICKVWIYACLPNLW